MQKNNNSYIDIFEIRKWEKKPATATPATYNNDNNNNHTENTHSRIIGLSVSLC